MSDTTLFLKRAASRAGQWSPVILRCTIWIVLAVATDLRHSVAEMAKKLAAGGAVTGWDWWDAILGVIVAAFLSWRTFLDETYTEHVKKQQTETEFLRSQTQQR